MQCNPNTEKTEGIKCPRGPVKKEGFLIKEKMEILNGYMLDELLLKQEKITKLGSVKLFITTSN